MADVYDYFARNFFFDLHFILCIHLLIKTRCNFILERISEEINARIQIIKVKDMSGYLKELNFLAPNEFVVPFKKCLL